MIATIYQLVEIEFCLWFYLRNKVLWNIGHCFIWGRNGQSYVSSKIIDFLSQTQLVFLVTMSKFLIYHFLYLLNYNLVVSRKDLKRTPKKCHICYLARQTNHCHLAWFVPRTSRPLYKPRWLSLYRSLSEMHYFAVKIWHFGSFFIFLF
jgi:hypothetical protein